MGVVFRVNSVSRVVVFVCVIVRIYTNKMSSVVEDFFACPSEALLESCTKEQLVQIAERFSVDLTSQEKRLKETIVTTLKRSLVDRGVIEVSTELITPKSQ